MREQKIAPLYSYTPEPPKKPPIIKVSCGIGDTDGFPAFDSDSDAYAAKDDSKWGFLITGGAEFHMPLTVFQVTPDGLADKGGVRLGDIVLEINEEDATQLTLSQAHEKINAAGKRIHFLVKSMADDEQDGYQSGEEKSIVLRVPKPPPPPKASIEQRLREMQRKLSEIAEIPKILSSTLATVAHTFDQLVPGDARQLRRLARRGAQQRKHSYDEDAVDYELSEELSGDELDKYAGDDEGEEDDDAAAKRKEATPESDYASEANYAGNEEDEDGDEGADDGADDDDYDCELRDYHEEVEDDEDEDDDEDESDDGDDDDDDVDADVDDGGDVYEGDESTKSLRVVFEEEEDEEDEDEEDPHDFLSTSYTWNLRNVPKLTLNDERSVEDAGGKEAEGGGEQPRASPSAEETLRHVKQEKLDRLERSWPWADREKIIYKQSTCHLVPQKPLGIIEKRIQLLAKQHLVANLRWTEQQKQQQREVKRQQ